MRITLWPEKDSWFRRNSTLVLCVMTMLLLTLGINEQGATIEQQKNLIRTLNADSQQLMAMKAQQATDAQRQAKAKEKADSQVAPDTKAAPKNNSDKQERPAASQKRQSPPKAEAVIDVREVRRTLLQI